MFSIDVILKYSPIPVAVQRKEKDAAHGVYHQIREAMQANPPYPIELSCEKQPDKLVTIMSDQVSAVVVAEKTAGSTGRVTGFLGIGSEGS
ncbi:hypothetical protein [Spirulina major]|uniref:hypothetical protein n=1 Tax=Spirulina major TaxID=270636 RepID=UPI000934510E|nr:hypothetical protein [Spirulina major]